MSSISFISIRSQLSLTVKKELKHTIYEKIVNIDCC